MGALKICLYDNVGNNQFVKYVKEFEVNEMYIIDQSIKKYATNEPCIIFKTCVMNATFIMLEEFFRNLIIKGVKDVKVSELPTEILDAIVFPTDVHSLKIL